MSNKIVVYSDLDGTILDQTYSFKEVQPIIQKLQTLNVAIVLNSSKTKAEIEHYRAKLSITDPFISENGSAIYIPKKYFKTPYGFSLETAQYNIIELGTPYSTLRQKLEEIKKLCKLEIVGFGDMTTEEIAKDSDLQITLAKLAQEREYDEPFKILSGKESDVQKAVEDKRLSLTKGGRYYHLMGKTDKGKATQVLTEIFLKNFQSTLTIGVGDGPNDESMLIQVDKPVLIQNSEPLPAWKEVLEIAETHTLNV